MSFRFAAAAIAFIGAPAIAGGANIKSLSFLDSTTFATGTEFGGQRIAGLSGIDYDPATRTFLAVRDNWLSNPSGQTGFPVAFRMEATPSASGGYTLRPTGIRSLASPGQSPVNGIESVRHDPRGDGVWLTSESPHTVYHLAADGTRRQLTLPDRVAGRFAPGTGNYGLEGLTFTPGGDMWVARENALAGDAADIVRLSKLSATGDLLAQVAYRLDTVRAPNRNGGVIANPPASGLGNNGVSEMLALSDTSFLVMERGWDGLGAGTAPTGVSHNSIRIYRVDTRGATDAAGIELLDGGTPFTTARKTLVWDSASLADVLNTWDSKIDNIEGMTFGAVLPDGRRSIVLVSDNNNSNSQRKTQFLTFGVNTGAIPEPESWAMMALGFGVAGATLRRRGRPVMAG